MGLTSSEAQAVLKTNPAYANTVIEACSELKLTGKNRTVCRACAALLLSESWFDGEPFMQGDPGGLVFPEETIRIQAKAAFNRCVSDGIIPGGIIGSLLYYTLRAAAWQFILYLVEEHWRKFMTTQMIKKSIDDSRWGL